MPFGVSRKRADERAPTMAKLGRAPRRDGQNKVLRDGQKDCFLARLARGCSFLLVQKRTKDTAGDTPAPPARAAARLKRRVGSLARGQRSFWPSRLCSHAKVTIARLWKRASAAGRTQGSRGAPAKRVPWERGDTAQRAMPFGASRKRADERAPTRAELGRACYIIFFCV